MVRICVNNLAGVPSIVFGVFGLAFFVYFVGSGVDHWFFADKLPTPTYGTPGILWASLTLAMLTLPVVIVATEEAFPPSRVASAKPPSPAAPPSGRRYSASSFPPRCRGF
jgi:ABC-type phosphate transport system permease subunit